MNLFVPQDDRLRHKILYMLWEKKASIKGKSQVEAAEISINVNEIAKRLKVTSQKVRMVVSTLIIAEEAQYLEGAKGELFSWKMGFVSLSEKKYLKQGHKQTMDSIYDVTKWVVPLSLAFVTIYTTIKVQNDNNRNKQMIDKLQSELNEFKKYSDTTFTKHS